MTLADELRAVPILAGFTDAQVAELAAAGTEVSYEPGAHLFDEGRPADDWWVLLSGRIDLVRRIGHDEAVMATMETAGQWAGGFRAWDEHGIYMGSARVLEPSRVFRLTAPELARIGEDWFPFAVHLLRGLIGTARRIEHNARQREALVALGTLAAGLAHEINNPASAAVRSVGALQQSSDDVFASLQQLAGEGISASQFVALDELRRSIDVASAPTGVALADLEESLLDWLGDHAVDRDWVIAPALAAAGVSPAWLDRAASALPGTALQAGLEWVASSVTTAVLIAEAQDATRRISDLVSAVKSYSQLDRAAVQDVRVVDGLESTLIMLGHKLRGGVTVVRDYDDSVPAVTANPGELNQVWTNLVDNAVDAMDGSGTLTLRTHADEHHVVVEVCDTGAGHDRRGRRPRLRAVLHDQGGREGDGPRPRHLPADRRRAARRGHRRPVGAGAHGRGGAPAPARSDWLKATQAGSAGHAHVQPHVRAGEVAADVDGRDELAREPQPVAVVGRFGGWYDAREGVDRQAAAVLDVAHPHVGLLVEVDEGGRRAVQEGVGQDLGDRDLEVVDQPRVEPVSESMRAHRPPAPRRRTRGSSRGSWRPRAGGPRRPVRRGASNGSREGGVGDHGPSSRRPSCARRAMSRRSDRQRAGVVRAQQVDRLPGEDDVDRRLEPAVVDQLGGAASRERLLGDDARADVRGQRPRSRAGRGRRSTAGS